MFAVLVFLDGTVCDSRPRGPGNTGDGASHSEEEVHKDIPVPGCQASLQQLAQKYQIVYIGARSPCTLPLTEEWLERYQFPKGPVFAADAQEDRLEIVKKLKKQYDFIAGIGDRYDDNELHLELGCTSIILKEYSGSWETVFSKVIEAHRRQKIRENRAHLEGKVEGLARVMPLFESAYGETMWEVWIESLQEKAFLSLETRREQDLQLFHKYGLNPNDLRDAARLDDLLREEDWENNWVYGLQDFELVEASETRYVHKVTRCYYADLWKQYGRSDIGYHIHCQTDRIWWDRPVWNPAVRFEQPETIMQGNDCCLFIQSIR